MNRAFRGSIRHSLGPAQCVEYPDGILVMDGDGKITACGNYHELSARLPNDCIVADHRGSWIVPGFIDCHVHLPQLDCRNKNGLTLLDWLKTYIYPAEAAFADPKMAEKIAPRFYDELLSHGITTAAIYSTVHYEATQVAFQVAEAKGLRAIIGQVLMDQNAPAALLRKPAQLLNESERLISEWHGKNGKLFFALTPRFALTCSKELIRSAGRMAEEARAYFQTHLAETTAEVAQAKEIHNFSNYSAFYESNFCLGDRSLFAHAIYLKEEEWKILAEHQSAIAHCPTSNIFLKSGTMPLRTVEKHNLRCGLGTDVGAGPTFSIREVIDCTKADESKAFYMATLGGAEALSMEKQIGNFTEGKWADFSIFDNPQFKGRAKEVFVAGTKVL